MKYSSVKNPQYIGHHKTQILVSVDFEGLGVVDFVADSNDIMPHGRKIHADIVAGKYGKIKPFTDDQDRAEKILDFRLFRNKFLSDTDWMVTRHLEQRELGRTNLSGEQFKQLLEVRQHVRDFTENPGFPTRQIDIPEWISTACRIQSSNNPGRGLAANA